MSDRYYIDKIGISITSLDNTVKRILEAVENRQSGYVCVTNTRTSYLANIDHQYCQIQNNSFITVPDGAPVVWLAKLMGLKQVGKASGKDLMDRFFSLSVKNGLSHYLYGSTPYTIEKMVEVLHKNYPGIEIKGAVSPPFQPLEDFDIATLANDINTLKPTFFWCGLGAPKQERLMALLTPHLNSTICFGVGLAFEYLGGTVKRAPRWMQKSGLEWSYRWVQQPKNIKREIDPFVWMIKNLIAEFLKLRMLKNK